MATKENMTSQRGMLKSIQSRVNTLASILYHGCLWIFKVGLGESVPLCCSLLWWADGQIRSLTLSFLRPVPHHQQSHPADQPAEKTGLSHPGLCDRHLHHPAAALRFALMGDTFKDWCALLQRDGPKESVGVGGVRSPGALDLDVVLSQHEALNFNRPSSSQGALTV